MRQQIAAKQEPRRQYILCLQHIKPFDMALQVAMAIIIHLELFVAIRAVSSGCVMWACGFDVC